MVTHAYASKFEDELTLVIGSEIAVLKSPEGGWWHGVVCGMAAAAGVGNAAGAAGVKVGAVGWFPSSHVRSKYQPPVRPRSIMSTSYVSHHPHHPQIIWSWWSLFHCSLLVSRIETNFTFSLFQLFFCLHFHLCLAALCLICFPLNVTGGHTLIRRSKHRRTVIYHWCPHPGPALP